MSVFADIINYSSLADVVWYPYCEIKQLGDRSVRFYFSVTYVKTA